MARIETEKVRELYAAATHYDTSHLRQPLNKAEFDDWLAQHDRALTVETLESAKTGLEDVVANMGLRGWDLTTHMDKLVANARGEKDE